MASIVVQIRERMALAQSAGLEGANHLRAATQQLDRAISELSAAVAQDSQNPEVKAALAAVEQAKRALTKSAPLIHAATREAVDWAERL